VETRVRESESELGIIVRRRCQGKGKESWRAEEQGALLYFLKLLCSALEYLRTRAAKGCLHILRVEVIGHGVSTEATR